MGSSSSKQKNEWANPPKAKVIKGIKKSNGKTDLKGIKTGELKTIKAGKPRPIKDIFKNVSLRDIYNI